eukprot:5763832-Pyramimonas_sp.AAC.1
MLHICTPPKAQTEHRLFRLAFCVACSRLHGLHRACQMLARNACRHALFQHVTLILVRGCVKYLGPTLETASWT